MTLKTWIRYLERPTLVEPTAIIGSPGIRSVGRIAVDHLVDSFKAELFAELCSIHFPLIFDVNPSYAPDPDFPGQAGIEVKSNGIELPRVGFYYTPAPELIVTRGYNADFYGQYEVAESALALFKELGVRKVIVLAGYGTGGKDVCCAATNSTIIKELGEKYGIEPEYTGPFYGFSGLVFGLARRWGMEAWCLFGRTEPDLDNPEYPDEETAVRLLDYLAPILGLSSTASDWKAPA